MSSNLIILLLLHLLRLVDLAHQRLVVLDDYGRGGIGLCVCVDGLGLANCLEESAPFEVPSSRLFFKAISCFSFGVVL
jgi:hypothetical protein